MDTTSVSIRMDVEVKKGAEELFRSLGLNMSTAVNIFLRQAIREQKIPFVIGETLPCEKAGCKVNGK